MWAHTLQPPDSLMKLERLQQTLLDVQDHHIWISIKKRADKQIAASDTHSEGSNQTIYKYEAKRL